MSKKCKVCGRTGIAGVKCVLCGCDNPRMALYAEIGWTCRKCREQAVAIYRRIKAGESVGPLVDMLPKTADGKPAAPGMDVWELRASGEIRKCWVYEIGSESAEARCGWGSPDPAWYRCYSTEEAAIQARNALSEKGGGRHA